MSNHLLKTLQNPEQISYQKRPAKRKCPHHLPAPLALIPLKTIFYLAVLVPMIVRKDILCVAWTTLSTIIGVWFACSSASGAPDLRPLGILANSSSHTSPLLRPCRLRQRR
ncbi:hypothetical protein M378DRAFT_164889 [Amanita muscaria Koide BX008]|uniref:Uncharacterized protein n=1 Tax=Amanita muscaria (strain Koide BX008) TaxID=946122 RepID=A0A0C2WNK2_AMAMK|nr:hypothetical protein M378DRAFT_164889 [Amanita muscaria Koide BX008]